MTKHPYAEFLSRIERPARYIGGEKFTIVKPEATLKFALAFPDAYEIGMSHLGFKILYEILNRETDVAAERVFAPWEDLERELRVRSMPLVTLETYRPLSEFDVVGFSLQYEMTYTNVLNMLDLGGIPLRSALRGETDPLIIAGGPCATSPEPLAPFIDAFVIGDGEETALEILRFWKEGRTSERTRAELLDQMARMPGIYVPSRYERSLDLQNDLMVVTPPATDEAAFAPKFPIERRVVEDLKRFPFPKNAPVAFTEVVFNRLSIELARGCTEGCRFCQAGMIYRPVRERDPKEVIDTLLKGIDSGGYDEASLTCLSTADYSCISPLISELMKELKKRNVKLGVSSLRAYGLSEDTMNDLAEGKASGLTFAPEAGTQRMRDVISKNVSEEEMVTSAVRAAERGWSSIKMYFMIGLPTETEEDVLGIAETGKRVNDAAKAAAKNPKLNVTVSVSSHVPKPHTPFQWCAMDSLDEIYRKQDLLKRMTRKFRVGFRYHNHRVSFIEGIISRGDIRIAELIEGAFRRGCRFDGWDDRFRFDVWMDVLREHSIDPSVYLRTLPVDSRLPWDHIAVGVTQKFLKTEYRRALQGRLSPPCGKPVGMNVHHTNLQDHHADSRKLVCYHCGIACDMDGMKTERADYLGELGAELPRPSPTPLPVFAPIPPAVKRPSARYRVSYAKFPPVSFVSHLDVVRMIPRHFRRAGITLENSAGFHPKPLMSFGPALPLGTIGLEELLDVSIGTTVPIHEFVDRLNDVSDPGLFYRTVEALTDEEDDLATEIIGATYLLSAPNSALALQFLEELERSPQAKVIRKRKGRYREMDVRDHLLSCTLFRGERPPELSGYLGEFLIQMDLRIGPSGSLRPSEVVQAVLPSDAEPWQAARTGFVRKSSKNSLFNSGNVRRHELAISAATQ